MRLLASKNNNAPAALVRREEVKCFFKEPNKQTSCEGHKPLHCPEHGHGVVLIRTGVVWAKERGKSQVRDRTAVREKRPGE